MQLLYLGQVAAPGLFSGLAGGGLPTLAALICFEPLPH